MLFTQLEYDLMHSIVFSTGFPGYKPEVLELPNGDGKVDATKRYAHIATKYLTGGRNAAVLQPFLTKAHNAAVRIAHDLGVPSKYMPRIEYGALRVLEYPPGAGSEQHTDFDLFTVLCYRDQPAQLLFQEDDRAQAQRLHDISRGLHLGEIGELVGLGQATPHRVLPSEQAQHAIVYFAIPDWSADLPTGVNVGDWIAERISRSRTYR